MDNDKNTVDGGTSSIKANADGENEKEDGLFTDNISIFGDSDGQSERNLGYDFEDTNADYDSNDYNGDIDIL